MNRPSFAIRTLGHPLVVYPVLAAGIYLLYLWFNGRVPWPAGVAALIGMTWVINASSRCRDYLIWRLEWEEMTDAPPARPFPWGKATAAGLVTVLLMALSNQPGGLDPVKLIVAAIFMSPVLLIGWVVVRLLRRRPSARTVPAAPDVVTICVPAQRNPPTTASAFQALPEHCLAALRTRTPSG